MKVVPLKKGVSPLGNAMCIECKAMATHRVIKADKYVYTCGEEKCNSNAFMMLGRLI